MKKEFAAKPPTHIEPWHGADDLFPWQDKLCGIAFPIFLVTTYKDNGKPNACLQSWSTLFGDAGHFLCIIGSVDKGGHLYKSLMQTKQCVLNFPSSEIFDKCALTSRNNGYDDDEIALSGLTAEPAKTVNAPRIAECFLNLECEFLWEKQNVDPSDRLTVCVDVKHVAMDSESYDEDRKGRYGRSGYVYNIHDPSNPDTGECHGIWLGELRKHSRQE